MIQNGCTEVSSAVSYYNQEEFMTGYNIRLDWHFGAGGYYLHMFGFDGTPKPWMWLTYNPPQMLPTRPLKQVVSSGCVYERVNVACSSQILLFPQVYGSLNES